MTKRRWQSGVLAGAAVVAAVNVAHAADPAWSNYGGDAQHTALAPAKSNTLSSIRWQTPVDEQPQYSGNGNLLVHYGSPLVTAANTVVVPVKTGVSDGFVVRGLDGASGALKWTATTDYILPPHGWTPSYAPAVTPGNRLYYPGAGGTVYYRDDADAVASTTGQIAFFGNSNYSANPAGYNSSVFINTPITSDAAGNIYFGFRVSGSTPLGSALSSGIARIGADGTPTYITAAAAATALGDSSITNVVMNCAPALSNDGTKLYVGLSNGTGTTFGDLVSLNSATLAPVALRTLYDPRPAAQRALLADNGSASPTVGPDGDVYYGVLENTLGTNHYRGWMLHFSADLSQNKTPGSFGWDDTASIVPSTMVPSYGGSSSYLLMCKYNNYAQAGGDGVNKLAIVDPNDTQIDPITGATVMKEILTIAGVTPDEDFVNAGFPNAVREWCINSAVVDPATNSVLANSEDGKLYRWDLTSNTFTEVITLTAGLGEAYTPTLVGADGAVYAINNATLFSVVPEPGSAILCAAGVIVLGLRRRRR